MPKSDYGFGARLLHYFALSSTNILDMSFMMDQMLRKSGPEHDDFDISQQEKHIFVSGLARAGTTALMRLFYETGEFCSLTYRDMPFPLAPFLWKRFAGFSAKEGISRERAHGDGILVDFDSPEAIEEVFWRVFCGDEYIFPDRLTPMEAEQSIIDNFRRYIAGLLKLNNSNRYLSKNNNNIIRLSSIQDAFPNSIVIIPYRDPIQQSLSLYNQHCRFVEIHRKDRFSRNYMKWLVHHEFGSDHRYFDVDKTTSTKASDNPECWLYQWIKVYRYLLKKTQEIDMPIIFVGYEELCDKSEVVWRALARYATVSEDIPPVFVLSKARTREGFHADRETINEAYRIYSELQVRLNKTLTNEKGLCGHSEPRSYPVVENKPGSG